MAAEKINYNFALIAIVAIVAIVGLVVMFLNMKTQVKSDGTGNDANLVGAAGAKGACRPIPRSGCGFDDCNGIPEGRCTGCCYWDDKAGGAEPGTTMYTME